MYRALTYVFLKYGVEQIKAVAFGYFSSSADIACTSISILRMTT